MVNINDSRGLIAGGEGYAMKDGEIKACYRCNIVRNLSEFYKSKRSKDGRQGYCKFCSNLDSSERAAALSPEEKAVKADYLKEYHLRKKYGISPDQWERMLEDQENRCAICKRPGDKWHTDHNHLTKKLREILCQSCNHLLGNAQDEIQVLENAIAYLRKHGGEGFPMALVVCENS